MELVSDNLRMPTMSLAELLDGRVVVRFYGPGYDVPPIVQAMVGVPRLPPAG